MKKFGIFAASLVISGAALADTITSPGAAFVSVPLTFQSTTGSGTAPFWNNYSSDGMDMNGGDYLTGSNPALGATNYLGTGGAFGNYLSTGSSTVDSTANFNFLQTAVSAQITLLYTNGLANAGSNGTEIGIYNVQNPTQKLVLFSHGSLYNPAAGGIYNNNVSPLTPFSVNTWANYGIYANTCGLDWKGVFCDTYYSNTALDQSSEVARQHFALFQNAQNPQSYFIGFEEGRGYNPNEGWGDYNDVVFRIQTTTSPIITVTDVVPTPEPATFSIIGLGLVGLGLLSRRRAKV
jgi:PEP-CTERM motif